MVLCFLVGAEAQVQNPLIPSKRNDRLLKEQAERLAREKEAREIYEGKKDDVGGMAEGDKKEEGGGESGVESQESRILSRGIVRLWRRHRCGSWVWTITST